MLKPLPPKPTFGSLMDQGYPSGQKEQVCCVNRTHRAATGDEGIFAVNSLFIFHEDYAHASITAPVTMKAPPR
jgi:hypothetical protein